MGKEDDTIITIKVSIKSGCAHVIIDGHSNYAPHGQDIVCAAVSAIIQTTNLGLQAIANSYPEHVQVIVE